MSGGKRTINSKLNLPFTQKTREFIFLSASSVQLILCLTKGLYATADQRFQAPIENIIHFSVYWLESKGFQWFLNPDPSHIARQSYCTFSLPLWYSFFLRLVVANSFCSLLGMVKIQIGSELDPNRIQFPNGFAFPIHTYACFYVPVYHKTSDRAVPGNGCMCTTATPPLLSPQIAWAQIRSAFL